MENKKDNLSELEALKADYALLKQSLEKQEATHARRLAEIKSRRISRLNKEMNRRIRPIGRMFLPFLWCFFVGIFSKLPYNESIQRIWIVGTVFVIVALVVEVVRYRKHHKLCQELLAQFDEEKNDAGE